MTLKEIIEALVFASQKPLTPKEMAVALRSAAEFSDDMDAKAFGRAKEAEIAAVLEQLKIEYIESGRAFELVEQVNGWSLLSKPQAALWVRQLYPESRPVRLSGPALETLAIVAYRQPITRADIEAVRGVAVDGVMQSLLDRGLVRIAGRAEVPGRPLLYETTQAFLEHFGLRAVDELPNIEELRRANLPTAPVPEPPQQPDLPQAQPQEQPAPDESQLESQLEAPAAEPVEAGEEIEAPSGVEPPEQP